MSNAPVEQSHRSAAAVIAGSDGCAATVARTVTLDVTGLQCPMPLLKAKKALNELAAGQRLLVVATDPGSVRDFQVFSEQSGHRLLESRQEGDRYCYLLEKRADV